jgi:glyoxylase-like metal-dependent hydrolase (beta-lactamase superfamily II)
MTVNRITDQLTQLVHRRVFNCYLVREDDGLTLIDTGPAGALRGLCQQIDRADLALRRVVITHAHGDHLGGLDQLTAEHGGQLEVVVGQREAALLTGDFALRDGEPEPRPRPRNYGQPQTRPTRTVQHGEHVGSLKVIHTPGHTPGHIALLDARDGTLIAGDALTTLGRTAVSGDLVWCWPFPAIATWNKPLARQSAQRLLDHEPIRLATGHGPVIENATTALAQAIDHRS